MAERTGIERKKSLEDPYSFQGLKQAGIKFAQDFSGNLWTDYNLHDPGVTILDQLCYAITDLIYRTDFPVQDYLTQENGTFDPEAQALHAPETIFPCRPITMRDYRKVLLDIIPQIDNVWLKKTEKKLFDGLYTIIVKLTEETQGHRAEEVREMVEHVYQKNRNLCEDLHAVVILDQVDCELIGEIEVRGKRDPAQIIAEVYYQCARRIAKGVRFYPYDDGLQQNHTFEEMFRGPFTRHGFIKEDELDNEVPEIRMTNEKVKTREEMLNVLAANLFSSIKGVEGVGHITNLSLQIRPQSRTKNVALDDRFPTRLSIPQHSRDLKVRVMKNGTRLPLPLEEIMIQYGELVFKERSFRSTVQDLSSQKDVPKGTFRKLDQYFSIQNHFPAIYGINAYGVPESSTVDVKARAMQLKTYLLVFEQIMANFSATLQHLRTLFSLENQTKQSYSFQVLDNHIVPNIESVYKRDPSLILKAVFGEGYDAGKYHDRKSRFLDYLLALYGEKFSQSSLRHFNFYYAPGEVEEVIINNKTAFLECIVELNQHRTSGLNYEYPSWNTDNVAVLKKKVSILLGFKYFKTRSLTDVFIEKGIELISDDQLTHIKEGAVQMEFVDLGDITDRTNEQFQDLSTARSLGKDTQQLSQEILFLKNNVVSPTLLQYGIYLDRYRIGSTGDDEAFQVVFQPHEGARWYYLSSYPTHEEAVGTVNDLRQFLIHLNVESEGVHIVEHILLRPDGSESHYPDVPDDFYSFRISVIFPSWTARLSHMDFRKLVEETVRLNCPAHICAEFYWLDFDRVREFEHLYMNWLEQKSGERGSVRECNDAAKRLIAFLLANREGP